MKRFYLALFFTCFFFSINAHAGYIEICTESWEKDWSPQNQGPEVESYTITVSCYNAWEDDYSWLYEPEPYSAPEPEQPPPVEELKTCQQMLLDVDAVEKACKVIEHNTANSLASGCPNLTHYVEASTEIGFTLKDFINLVFGVTLGTTYNAQCEARLTFDLGAKIAACEFSASKSKAIIGPCN